MISKLNITALFILITAFIATVLTHTVRHYFIINNYLLQLIINSLPSFCAAIGFSMIPIIINIKKQAQAIIAICIGLILYEFEQYYTIRVFDFADIISSIFGTSLGLMISYKFKTTT